MKTLKERPGHNSGAGFLITPAGKNGNYFGNALFADNEHRLAKAFDGDLTGSILQVEQHFLLPEREASLRN